MNESVKKIITCKWCNEALKSPVFLPCGETICSKHEDAFKLSSPLKCRCCGDSHKLSYNEHFPVNKMAQDLLENKFNELNFGNDFKAAQEKFKQLQELADEYQVLRKNSDGFVAEFFGSLRNRVHLVREDLISKIHECSGKLIAQLDSYERDCENKMTGLDLSDEGFAQIKTDLSRWERELGYLKTDRSLWCSIKNESVEHVKSLKKMRSNLESQLVGRKLEIEASFSDVFNLFGKHVGFKRLLRKF